MSLMGERKLSVHVYCLPSPASGVHHRARQEGQDWAVSCWSREFENKAFFSERAEAVAYATSHLREHGPGELVVYGVDGELDEQRFVELYGDIPANRSPRTRPSGLAERAAA